MRKNYSSTHKDHTDSSQAFKKNGFPKTHIKGTLDSCFPALLKHDNGLSKQLSLNQNMYEDFSEKQQQQQHFSPSKKMRRENIYNSLSLQNNACHTP